MGEGVGNVFVDLEHVCCFSTGGVCKPLNFLSCNFLAFFLYDWLVCLGSTDLANIGELVKVSGVKRRFIVREY